MNENEYYEALSRQSWKIGCLLSFLMGLIAFLLLCLAKEIGR